MTWLGRLFGTEDTLPYSGDELKIFAASRRIGLTAIVSGVAGLCMIAIWAHGVVISSDVVGLAFSMFFGADLLVALAAAAAGGLFGFIFGIPRTLDPASRAAVANAAAQGPTAASHALMAANTNLERISDWLTTLLIGATLVQIKNIIDWIGALGKNLTTSGPAANDAVVPIIVIYFFALSFLGVYLITRLYLTSAFQQTLGLLAGAGLPLLDELKRKLDAVAKSNDPAVLKEAADDYGARVRDLSVAESENPELNAKVARVLVKLMKNGAEVRTGDPLAKLMDAVHKAAADTNIKAALKKEGLDTGDSALNGEIGKILA